MCVCVCVCACLYMCVCVCVCVCVFICVSVCIYICMCVCPGTVEAVSLSFIFSRATGQTAASRVRLKEPSWEGLRKSNSSSLIHISRCCTHRHTHTHIHTHCNTHTHTDTVTHMFVSVNCGDFHRLLLLFILTKQYFLYPLQKTCLHSYTFR